MTTREVLQAILNYVDLDKPIYIEAYDASGNYRKWEVTSLVKGRNGNDQFITYSPTDV